MSSIHLEGLDAQHPDWPEALATVLSCTYKARVGRAMAFGLPSRKHFHITYNFWAEGALHTAELYSAQPLPQGSLFPVRYNPADLRNDRAVLPSSTTPDWTSRFALAALLGFFSGLVALPVACGGFVLVNQHRFGDVDHGGPASVLGGLLVGTVLGLSVMLLVWRKTRPR